MVEQRAAPAIGGKFEPRLMAADQLHIDRRKQAAIEQRAVLVALGKIDAVALAQRIEAARRAGMPPPRQRQRIDHPVPAKQRAGEPLELGIEEGEVEGGVVHDQHGAFDEAEHVVGALMEARLGRAGTRWRARAPRRPGMRHVALGIEMAMPHPARRDAVEQLDAPISTMRWPRGWIEPRRFGVEHDLAHEKVPPKSLVRDEAAP